MGYTNIVPKPLAVRRCPHPLMPDPLDAIERMDWGSGWQCDECGGEYRLGHARLGGWISWVDDEGVAQASPGDHWENGVRVTHGR